MKRQYLGLIVVAVVVLITLFSFIAYNSIPFRNSKKIILDTRPIDPFDPFRGQYMAINYEISRISTDKKFETGDTAYVLLQQNSTSKVWDYKDIFSSRPSSGDFIKGKVKDVYGTTLSLEYGIEQYFFEKGAELPTRNVTVEVLLTSSGRSQVSQMLQNGKPIKIEYRNLSITS